MTDILVVVGPRSFADVQACTYVRDEVLALLQADPPDEIWSGGADGGDTYAEAAAREFAHEYGIRFRPVLPQANRWAGTGGFKARDDYMAYGCTRLLGFACRWPISHGAIYTANTAERLGKPVHRVTLPWDVTSGQVDFWDASEALVQLRVRGGVVAKSARNNPGYAADWLGQPIDPVLRKLRKQKLRVRWTTEYPDLRAAEGGTGEHEDGNA